MEANPVLHKEIQKDDGPGEKELGVSEGHRVVSCLLPWQKGNRDGSGEGEGEPDLGKCSFEVLSEGSWGLGARWIR